MKILIVEDDKEILSFLQTQLPEHGFVVDGVETGVAGITHLEESEYDLIILDLNLPDMLGEEIVEKVHDQQKHKPPILMLTVVSSIDTKTRLLNAGADDYLEKPFVLSELVARIRALMRRAPSVLPKVLTAEDISLDVRAKTLMRDDQMIELTRTEFTLLEYLLAHKGDAVSKQDLVAHVWGGAVDSDSNTLEMHMANLRKKVGDGIIHTVRGVGYKVT